MQIRRFSCVLTALAMVGTMACHRQSASDRMIGIWQFSGMDATMDYVFKADRTFEVWAPSMDAELSKGPWLQMDFGSWQVQGDELIIESKRTRSPEFKKMFPRDPVDRLKVLRFGPEKIEFQHGGPFIRATSRRGI